MLPLSTLPHRAALPYASLDFIMASSSFKPRKQLRSTSPNCPAKSKSSYYHPNGTFSEHSTEHFCKFLFHFLARRIVFYTFRIHFQNGMQTTKNAPAHCCTDALL